MELLDPISPLREAKNMLNALNHAKNAKYTIICSERYRKYSIYTWMGNWMLTLVHGTEQQNMKSSGNTLAKQAHMTAKYVS